MNRIDTERRNKHQHYSVRFLTYTILQEVRRTAPSFSQGNPRKPVLLLPLPPPSHYFQTIRQQPDIPARICVYE